MTTIFHFYKNIKHKISSKDFYDLLSKITKKKPAVLLASPSFELSKDMERKIFAYLNRLETGEPIEYLLGWTSFWDLKLKVDKNVLIPRDDTEILVESALHLYDKNTPLKILDLGTGSGAIGLALAKNYHYASVLGVDKYISSLKVADNNKKINKVSNFFTKKSDWFNDVSGKFDLIVSNPPYIAKNDTHLSALKSEPLRALASGDDGLQDIRYILLSCHHYLKRAGYLIIEHGYQQKVDLINLASKNNKIYYKNTIKDFNNLDRISIFVKK